MTTANDETRLPDEAVYMTEGLRRWRRATDGILLVIAIGSLPLLLLEFKRAQLPYADRILLDVVNVLVLVAFAVDYAVELIQGSLTDPLPRKQPWLPLHEHCLFKNGIHLGEMFYFTELARWLRAHKRSRFLFTAPPLRLPGAVGSPATPVGTV